jgi:uncharacterized protein affecting Mg2+/Co2+ transport/tetrahydromethanopterin S-methyltransferase subunit G
MNRFTKCILVLLVAVAAMIPQMANAQKGTVKIFSEIKGVSVYLDNINQGVDAVTIDSVQVGSHYLKITKDSTILYSELIGVNTNAVTTILVKQTKEITDKLIPEKYEEKEKYKAQKVDVLINTQYVTETNDKTNSMYFPGYYSVIGVSNTKSTSVTYQTKDWFLATEQGRVKINEYDFARLSGNQALVDKMDAERKRAKVTMNVAGGIGTAIMIGGLTAGIVGVADLASKRKFVSTDVAAGLTAGGVVGFLVGAATIGAASGPTARLNAHHMTIEQAITQARAYNQKLKKQLGLAESYEP